jgi:anti-sigma regulatory factor (Ser/Thr protein kinase)
MSRHVYSIEPDVSRIPALLDWLRGVCDAAGIGADIVFKVTLAIEEAAMNVISHAFRDAPPPHRAYLRLAFEPTRLVAELVDNGVQFDPSDQPPPDLSLPLEERDIGGLGIHLIRTMMDRVEYRRVEGENRLTLEKWLAPPDRPVA